MEIFYIGINILVTSLFKIFCKRTHEMLLWESHNFCYFLCLAAPSFMLSGVILTDQLQIQVFLRHITQKDI